MPLSQAQRHASSGRQVTPSNLPSSMRTSFVRILSATLLTFAGLATPSFAQTAYSTIFYVDWRATAGSNNGLTWNDAFLALEDALNASIGQTPPIAICVAEGKYAPNGTMSYPPGNTDPRSATFLMVENVHMIGGFEGLSSPMPHTDPNDPDGDPNSTVLSGDLGGGSKAYHVIVNPENNILFPFPGAVSLFIDRFLITDGSATPSGPAIVYEDEGGAFLNRRVDARVLISNTSIAGNRAALRGGAIHAEHNTGGFLALKQCRISNNVAPSGGALYYLSSATILYMANVQFAFNGGLSMDNTQQYCDRGGAIYLADQTDVEAANCLFHDNAARIAGGAIYWQPFAGVPQNFQRQHYRHCTFTLNAVLPGPGGALSAEGAGIHIDPANHNGGSHDKQVWLENTIIRGNRFGQDISLRGGVLLPSGLLLNGIVVKLDHCCYELAKINSTATAPGGIVGPIAGFDGVPSFISIPGRDLRLQATSLCVDQGDNSLRGTDYLDIDDDPSTTILPLDYWRLGRIVNGVVDIGANEKQ
jgi:hypothetical protein